MDSFESFRLKNGLKVILQKDSLTPMVAVNIIYKVGAANEDPQKTGLAHFLEHMMFTGTQKYPNFDDPLQLAGGDSNAYTSSDVTSYNAQLPAENLNIALALEADRMSHLGFNTEAYKIQKNVIKEEYKEQYLMKPYGDLWKTVKEQLYSDHHPYHWMPIGKDLEAIENITLEDLKIFYDQYYVPNNACLAVVGNLPIEEMKSLVLHYFDPIPSSKEDVLKVSFFQEDTLKNSTPTIILKGEVPETIVLWTTFMPSMFTPEYYCAEFWLYYINSQENSPLYKYLVHELELATEVYAYHSDSFEKGILAIEIRGLGAINVEDFSELLNQKIQSIFEQGIPRAIHEAILNKIKTSLLFEELSAEYKAHKMALLGLFHQESLIENELNRYSSVTESELMAFSNDLIKQRSKQFYYFPDL